jgi:hypothetical protein
LHDAARTGSLRRFPVRARPSRFIPAPTDPVGFFRWSLVTVTLIKLLLAIIFPLTGDEAYFVQWGRELAGSYYDHGPVTGWWIWLLLQLGDAAWLIRLPAVGSSLLVAYVLWRLLRPHGETAAALAASLFLWSPPSVLTVLMTTDTPLLVFSVLSAAAAVRAHRTDRPLDYLLSGVLLGLAFLAKYFAVLLGIAYAVWWLFLSERRRPLAVALILLGVAPFAVQHMYWNYHHSWVNVVFNLFTRQEDEAGLAWHGPLIFGAMIIYLLGPVAYALLRWRNPEHRVGWREAVNRLRALPLGLWAVAFAVPHMLFLLVSLRHVVGLHWLLSFYPFVFVLLAFWLHGPTLARLLRPMMWFGLVHAALVLIVALLPIELARQQRSYASIVLGVHPEEVAAALAPYLDDYQPVTRSYAKSALLEYHLRQPVPVLGIGSFHGRQDDLRTDFREFAGRALLVLGERPDKINDAREWFSEWEVQTVEVRGATLHLLLGRGFRYDRYREQVLQTVAEKYYIMPPWLRRFSAGCYFRARYDLAP